MSKTPVTNVASMISMDEMEDRKRALAYQMWEEEGRPEGKAEEHWDRACLLVMELDAEATAEKPGWLKRNELDGAKPKTDATVLKPLDRPVAAEEMSRIPAKRSAA
jgi:Protein of unknown function (DUF2934)